MSKENNNKSAAALVLSIAIHGTLAAFIIYAGLDMTLPTGTVTSDEMEFQGAIPDGSQTSDPTQEVDIIEKTSSAAKPPPPPPPPPPPAPVVKEVKAKTAPPPPPIEDEKSEVPIQQTKEEPEPVEENTEDAEELAKEIAAPAPTPEELSKDVSFDENSENPESKEEPAETPVALAAAKVDEATAPPSANESAQESSAQAQPDGASNANSQAYGADTVHSDSELSPMPGNVPPEYPMWARLRKQQGNTVLQFQVLADGSVSDVQITKSSGYEILDSAAVKAHTKWKYRPGKTGTFRKTYVFNLKGKAEEAPSLLRRGNKAPAQ